jgi:hypothetical protein
MQDCAKGADASRAERLHRDCKLEILIGSNDIVQLTPSQCPASWYVVPSVVDDSLQHTQMSSGEFSQTSVPGGAPRVCHCWPSQLAGAGRTSAMTVPPTQMSVLELPESESMEGNEVPLSSCHAPSFENKGWVLIRDRETALAPTR